MSLSHFCEWLATTRGSIALHESLYMYPLVESVHVLTLCLFVGLAASLFTAYFFTRLLFDLIYGGRRRLEAISV